ncbi:MAG: prepilin-type N-terminal cleavage/methylation domain-containing protein [Phycisphaerales bacterium]|nr:MAG: prepilin-type N-terminal cleavage/methylation domain-containing protein [Phycisphaerales bacterium]
MRTQRERARRDGDPRAEGGALRSGRPGFTLLEILVVIAIIALLLAILLPGLNRARQTARKVECAAHLRQIGVGWTIYADQNKGHIVPGRPAKFADPERNKYWVGNGYHYRPRWFVQMGAEAGFHAFKEPSIDPRQDNVKLVDGDEVFLCPEVPERTNNRNYAYGYNYQFLGNSRFRGGLEAKGFIRFPVAVTTIVGATFTVMAADAMGTAAGKPERQRTGYRQDGGSDLYAVGDHAWALDPPRLTATSDYCDDSNRAPEHRSAVEPRHGDVANVLFCDIHVSSETFESLGYVVAEDGRVVADDEKATNKLFSGTGKDTDPPPIQ